MATAQVEKVKEDWLTCVICSDYYTDPCTLTCQHSFCRQCLTQYTKTKPEAVKSKTIPCPSCRQVTNVPDPARPVEEWAEQLKPGIVLQGLIDTLHRGETEKETGNCCNICAQLGETTQATVWCHDCEIYLCDRCRKSHQVTPVSRDHIIGDTSLGSKIHRRQKVMCRRQKVLCRQHKDEYIKFHCEDCNKSACQTCCIIHHRACKSVVTIESLRSLCRKREVISKRLKVKLMKVGETKTAIKTTLQKQTHTIAEIKSVCRKAIDKTKRREKELIDKLNKVAEKRMNQLQDDMKIKETDIQVYQQRSEFIGQALDADGLMDIYNTYQVCQSVVEIEVDRYTNIRQMLDEFSYSYDTDKFQNNLDNIHLGEITVTHTNTCSPHPVLYKTTVATTERDKEDPGLIDVTVLFVDGVQTAVVSDYNNNCVKSFYSRNNHSCHSTLLLGDFPWGITQMKEKNQVMVAVPESFQIVTAEVTPDLVLLSTISTSKKYVILVVLGPSSLAASGGPPVSVDILNMEGQVMKSLSTHNNVELFAAPGYIGLSRKGNILVSDFKKKSVTCLTSEGDVVWTYTPTGDRSLTKPWGITTTREGEILFVDSDSLKVIQLTESGQYVRDVLTVQNGLSAPAGIYLDRHGSLYVCDWKEIKEFLLC